MEITSVPLTDPIVAAPVRLTPPERVFVPLSFLSAPPSLIPVPVMLSKSPVPIVLNSSAAPVAVTEVAPAVVPKVPVPVNLITPALIVVAPE